MFRQNRIAPGKVYWTASVMTDESLQFWEMFVPRFLTEIFHALIRISVTDSLAKIYRKTDENFPEI